MPLSDKKQLKKIKLLNKKLKEGKYLEYIQRYSQAITYYQNLMDEYCSPLEQARIARHLGPAFYELGRRLPTFSEQKKCFLQSVNYIELALNEPTYRPTKSTAQELYLYLGHCFTYLSNLAKAIFIYQMLINNPSPRAIRIFQMDAYFSLGMIFFNTDCIAAANIFENALNRFSRELKGPSLSAQEKIIEQRLYFYAADISTFTTLSINDLKKYNEKIIKAVYPNYPDFGLVKGKLLLLKGEITEAIDHFNDYHEENEEIDYFRGLAHMQQQNWESALAKLEPNQQDHWPSCCAMGWLPCLSIEARATLLNRAVQLTDRALHNYLNMPISSENTLSPTKVELLRQRRALTQINLATFYSESGLRLCHARAIKIFQTILEDVNNTLEYRLYAAIRLNRPTHMRIIYQLTMQLDEQQDKSHESVCILTMAFMTLKESSYKAFTTNDLDPFQTYYTPDYLQHAMQELSAKKVEVIDYLQTRKRGKSKIAQLYSLAQHATFYQPCYLAPVSPSDKAGCLTH